MKASIILTVMGSLFGCWLPLSSKAQAPWQKEVNQIRFSAAHTAFPEEKRFSGYTNDGRFFDAAGHYSDSSVLLLVPRHLKPGARVDLIFWFHGWNNNIDTALVFYQLAAQFAAAHRNAVLVLAETAKNAADSYAGKLEQPGIFDALVLDVMGALQQHRIVPKHSMAGNIVLAGHSGAYRAIAFILQNSSDKIVEVDLFDALYSQTDKFMNWIQKDSTNRFINWYTNEGGGTDEVSIQMMEQMKKVHIPFSLTAEKDLSRELLQRERILFVHAARPHNNIINNPDNFKLLLETAWGTTALPKKK